MKKYFSLVILSLLPALAFATPELSGSPGELSHYLLEQKKIINIQGEAERKIETDTAVVAITVKTKASRLEHALEQNEGIRAGLRQTLQQAGIAKEHIKASKFSSTPNHSWFKDKPSSYEVNNEVKISIQNEAQLQAIARLIDGTKEMFLGATEHRDSSEQDNKLKVLETALDDIQTKRALYEKKLGIQLRPIRIINQNVFSQTIQARPRMMQKEIGRISSASDALEAEGSSSDFGSITYKANAVVEFLVE